MQHLYKRIYADPEFHALEKKRGRFSWLLAGIVFLTYFSFILVIAFVPEVFGKAIVAGRMMTWGIPAGIFVIVFSFCLTGVYVYRANNEFDRLIRDIVENVQQSENI